ncbi:mannitol dehydrogenase [Brevundimonas sp. LM2]|uniref:mannitol dehydrogenase family protein n=1 Tax=Brevundimonas sp. LM2 TaxID=1938605 RepID=UPI000983CE29|nr:mannitol dehydrogenase family protein [Brevundimonas sp. LM2]AQR61306.1 mannitol dehydrogenase [Brevundimonas sp. LM2]
MSPRLSDATLAGLPAEVERPGYDRAAVTTGVVHLGIGAFHRAHQAVVFDDALRSGDRRWSVLGVSLRSPGVRDQLQPQDGLYSLRVRDGSAETVRIIGAVRRVLVAPEDPGAVVVAMASADVHLVTLTVTEKGYRLDPATGALIQTDPDILADIADPARPRTAPGFLVAALAERRRRGLPPFTVISCDNLPHNGARVRAAVLGLAERIDPDLAAWIAEQGAFPATMVDRIVPATTPDDIAALTERLGVEDAGMVKTEPFTQWVIEDRFAGPRPDFAALGVQLTGAVAPWEDAKLRLLNGAHSAIAYLGGLAGHDFVHRVVGETAFAAFVERLWDEAQTTLNPPPGLDIPAYRAALMARFRNEALQHRTRQIAMDGSQKLPQRLLATMADCLAANQGIDALALAVAGWIRWQAGVTETGETFVVDDPLADRLRDCLAGAATVEARVQAVIDRSGVVPPSLAGDMRFAAAVTQALAQIESRGVLTAIG